ncbi:MAG: hypothetical protein ABW128_16880 [Rhizorhabdus sp.]
MTQDHKAFPYIAKLIGDCVHNNGGTAGRNFAGIADPAGDIMKSLDECLGAEGIYFAELKALDDWMATLTDEQFDTITNGEDTEMSEVFSAAPGVGDASAREWIDAVYEHCI